MLVVIARGIGIEIAILVVVVSKLFDLISTCVSNMLEVERVRYRFSWRKTFDKL